MYFVAERNKLLDAVIFIFKLYLVWLMLLERSLEKFYKKKIDSKALCARGKIKTPGLRNTSEVPRKYDGSTGVSLFLS
jgi:hypothetical protein